MMHASTENDPHQSHTEMRFEQGKGWWLMFIQDDRNTASHQQRYSFTLASPPTSSTSTCNNSLANDRERRHSKGAIIAACKEIDTFVDKYDKGTPSLFTTARH